MNRVGMKSQLTEDLKIKVVEDRKNKITVSQMSEKYNISKSIINNYFNFLNKKHEKDNN